MQVQECMGVRYINFVSSAVKQKCIDDTQTFLSPHWLTFFFLLHTTAPLSQISHRSLISSPSVTYSQPLHPSLLSAAALPSVPPSQTTCYSVQGGCKQHCSTSSYRCCRTRLFDSPFSLSLSLPLSDNQTFSLTSPWYMPETMQLKSLAYSSSHLTFNSPDSGSFFFLSLECSSCETIRTSPPADLLHPFFLP